jgi:5'-nucleotidase
MGRGRFQEFFERRTDTRQHDYYWMDGRVLELNESEELDQAAVHAGYISVTPLRFDLTDHELLQELNRWNLE